MKNKRRLILSIVLTLIILIGSSYAVYRYLRILSAVGITNKEIKVTYTNGNNVLEFEDAYPISDEYATSNLNNMSYVDFSISGIEGNPNIAYETGEYKKEHDIVINMYKDKVPFKTISKYTKLPIDKIKEIINNNKI